MKGSESLPSDPIGEWKHWKSIARAHLRRSAEVQLQTADTCLESMIQAAETLGHCFRSARKVLICGNGGSAADAQHIAAEFVNRLSKDFERPGLPAIALTTDTSFLTSYANDYDFAGVFGRQVQALGQPGDVLLAISTSGNSKNVIVAVETARDLGLQTIGLVGEGGTLPRLVDCAVVIPSRDTQHVQEALLAVEHVLCLMVEQALFGTSATP